MSENCISISNLNDFKFCPASIYFHTLDIETEKLTYQSYSQLNGTAVHERIDNNEYSDKKNILQAVPVYSEEYNVYGKIDIFDLDKGILTERKKKIVKIYDGYVFQLYAQCFALREAGYKVLRLRLYSMDDNKNYDIKLPENDMVMLNKFNILFKSMNEFDISAFRQNNAEKCNNCIYEPMCAFSLKDSEII